LPTSVVAATGGAVSRRRLYVIIRRWQTVCCRLRIFTTSVEQTENQAVTRPNSTSPVSPKSSVACPPHSITSHYSKRQLDRFRRFCTTDVAFPYTLHLIAPFHFTTKFTCTGKSPTIYTGVSGMSSTCYEEVGDKLATSYGLVTGKLWGNWSSGIWPISACIFTPAA